MKKDSQVIRQFLLGLVLTLSLGGCSVDSGDTDSNNAESPEFESAQIVLPVEDRRIAIVHSQTSKANFYDPFAYNQLFAAMQHQSMMAGIPFDLLDEDQLAAPIVDLLAYDTIIIPALSHVKSADRASIVSRLQEAQQNGVGIITSGEFLGAKEDGTAFTDFTSAMVALLGVQPVEYFSGVEASIKVANNTHPVTKSYSNDEEVQSYDQIWFGSFEPVNGEQSTALTLIETDTATYTGAQIIDRAGRVVHFANDQVMADNNMLWRVIQWMTYEDIAPVSLQVSRADHVFLARNGYKKNKCCFSADWTVARHRRPTLSSADCPEWLLKFICIDTIAAYYLTFPPQPELRVKPKSYRGPQRSLLNRTFRIGIRRKGPTVVPGFQAMGWTHW